MQNSTPGIYSADSPVRILRSGGQLHLGSDALPNALPPAPLCPSPLHR
nr:hypothetical protein [Microbulbifer agarilyticus]